jgi:2-polyprenyl-3-methyl-5-hydroxy-6-metoxy-1,4-benzoquinol methylase
MFARLPRCREQEIMDQPGLLPSRHRAALAGLARINRLSASAGIVWPRLRALSKRVNGQPVRVLDIASGGGDVPIRVWQRAQRAGMTFEIDGCDISPTAIEYAARQAAAAGAAVRFFSLDAVHDSIPDGYDALMCSLFLHHLDEPDALELLRRMGEAARHLVVVNDLSRSRTGLFLAHVATRLLTRSAVVHTDGPLSVHAAFTPAEALALAERAGLHGATVSRRWPCRFLLTWERHA